MDGAAVEVDETYIGGRARNMHPRKKRALGLRRGGSFAGKVAVMGLLERNTDTRACRHLVTPIQVVPKRAFLWAPG